GGAGDVEGQGADAGAVRVRGLPGLDEPHVQALAHERAEGGGDLVGGHLPAGGDGEGLTLPDDLLGGVERTGGGDLAPDELLIGEHRGHRVHVGGVVDRRVEPHVAPSVAGGPSVTGTGGGARAGYTLTGCRRSANSSRTAHGSTRTASSGCTSSSVT